MKIVKWLLLFGLVCILGVASENIESKQSESEDGFEKNLSEKGSFEDDVSSEEEKEEEEEEEEEKEKEEEEQEEEEDEEEKKEETHQESERKIPHQNTHQRQSRYPIVELRNEARTENDSRGFFALESMDEKNLQENFSNKNKSHSLKSDFMPAYVQEEAKPETRHEATKIKSSSSINDISNPLQQTEESKQKVPQSLEQERTNPIRGHFNRNQRYFKTKEFKNEARTENDDRRSQDSRGFFGLKSMDEKNLHKNFSNEKKSKSKEIKEEAKPQTRHEATKIKSSSSINDISNPLHQTEESKQTVPQSLEQERTNPIRGHFNRNHRSFKIKEFNHFTRSRSMNGPRFQESRQFGDNSHFKHLHNIGGRRPVSLNKNIGNHLGNRAVFGGMVSPNMLKFIKKRQINTPKK